ncbi:hypothetical protein PSU4_39760 [Pseudonocardia sulfidoxydans NBRC 16205]|uniref:Uncharacterized protein n=1 Tax=Pseudonocardia sulfidoxydans NBRC 16205 TaxID=1223511 RepID=A0A511DJP6_9PSEU|nr:hypothetical protein PSU4_39760 [Pseudonocardia sulfidoxydans NBRC 16205]
MNLGRRLANGFASDDAATETAEEVLSRLVPEPSVDSSSRDYEGAHSPAMPASPLPAIAP